MSSCQSQALLYTLHNSAYLKNILFPPTGGRSRWTVLPASPHWNIQRALRPLQEGETQLPGRNTVLKTEVRAWNKQLSDHSESGSRHAPGLAQQLVSKGAAFLLFLACGRICQLVRPQLGFQRVTLDFSTGRKNATPPYHFSIISIIVSQSSHLSNSCPFPSPPRYLTDTSPSLITSSAQLASEYRARRATPSCKRSFRSRVLPVPMLFSNFFSKVKLRTLRGKNARLWRTVPFLALGLPRVGCGPDLLYVSNLLLLSLTGF